MLRKEGMGHFFGLKSKFSQNMFIRFFWIAPDCKHQKVGENDFWIF